MATYVNNLRLKEIVTGEESGTWGTSTNTNLELIADALGSGTEGITTNADTHTTTIADGSADEGRALFLKYTGTLDSTCTITLAPDTVNKLWIIENATSGSQDIAISQGSGANVTIGNGKVAAIFTDGAGGGAAVLDAFTDLVVTDSFQVAGPTLTIGDATAEDTKLVFDGNAQDFYVGLDDSADDLVIGLGSTVGTTPAVTIDENQAVVFPAASVTVGDGTAEDTKLVYDGNAQDYYIGLDDSADDLVIGLGSTVGTTPAVTIDENQAVVFPAAAVTIGDGTAEDTKLVYDGNAQDYYIGLDDSADDLVIGLGSTVGTTPAVTIDENQAVVFPAATVTIGDGTAEDTKLVYNGNAQDFYIGLDDSADDLLIGLGSTVGTTPAISIDENVLVTVADNLTLISDSAVLGFGVDTDVTLTHVHNVGLSLNKDLRIAADDEMLVLGAGQDASLFYNGTHMVAKPNDVGSGVLLVTATSGTIPTLDGPTVMVVQRNSGAGQDCRLTLLGGAGGQTVLDFADASDQNVGAVVYDHSSNYMDLRVDAASRLRIDSSGNVGIGLTSMSYKLDVSGTVRIVGLPTSDPGVAGALWDSSGDLKISQ